MTETSRVVVYGSSLYMAGLATSLKANPSLDVIHVHTGSPALAKCGQTLKPVAIVFDLGEIPADLVLVQLRACPGLVLIGVDAASEDILLLSGQQASAVTMSDMARLITQTGTEGSRSSSTEHRSPAGEE